MTVASIKEQEPVFLHNESTAITEFKQRLQRSLTERGVLSGLSYQPRLNDVLLASGPKCGTTWMQQICNELRWAHTNIKAMKEVGEEKDDESDERLVSILKDKPLEFREITEVVPFLEAAWDCGGDLEGEQPYGENVRFLKTHSWAVHCPGPFEKTIVVIRDPVPTLLSCYRFLGNWFFQAGDVSLEEFGLQWWLKMGFPDTNLGRAGYFAFLSSWYKEFVKRVIEGGNQSSMIFVFYEDLIDGHEDEVTRIARFLSTDTVNYCTNAIIRLVVERSSYQFMKKNERFFDSIFEKIGMNKNAGLNPDAGKYSSKVSQGYTAASRLLVSEPVLKEIERQWKDVIESETGFATYEELRHSFRVLREEGRCT